MAVYVDPPGSAFGKKSGVTFTCHMIADTPEELYAMAERMGLKRRWAQGGTNGRTLHYDLNARMRSRAIAAGAIDADRRMFVNVIRRGRG